MREKIMVVDSSTENCDVNMSISEGGLFELVEADFENYYRDRLCEDTPAVFEKLKKTGEYIDPEDEAQDPILIYRKEGSVFGTDMVQLKYWSPEDILNRFSVVYVVMPEES